MESKKEKLNINIILPFGLLVAGWSALWAAYNNFLPVFLQAGNPDFDKSGAALTLGFGLSAFYAGLLMSIDNLISLFSGPIIGRWSDRVGKRMPFVKYGTPLAIVGFIAIPFAVKLITPETNGNLSMLMVPFILVFLLALAVISGYAISTVPGLALRYQLIPSQLRSQATGFIELIGAFGGVLGYLLSGMLYNIDISMPFIVFGVFFMLALFYLVKATKEPQNWAPASEAAAENVSFKGLLNVFKDFSAQQKRNVLLIMLIGGLFNFGSAPIQTFGSSYVVNVLKLSEGSAASMGAIFFIGYLLGTVPMGYLPKWLKRKGTLALGAAISITGAAVILLVPNFTVLQIMIGLIGFGFATPQIINVPMLSDIVPNAKSFGAVIGLLIFCTALASTISVPFWGKMIDLTANYGMVWIAVIAPLALAVGTSLFLTMGEAKKE